MGNYVLEIKDKLEPDCSHVFYDSSKYKND